MTRAAVIVAGPTCSGKSALAIALGQHFGGTIVNADSMQVYRELRVLTARPTPGDEALVPHLLYGVRAAAEPGSVGWWRRAALGEMDGVYRSGGVPILCGGTGLYLGALVGGLADVPDPGREAREEARFLLQQLGAAGLHERLALLDPETAGRLNPEDGQRVARAWEVLRGTGVGLASWQACATGVREASSGEWNFAVVLLDPPREHLRTAIGARFAKMVRSGAIEEVEALMALRLDPRLPAMRALGVRQLSSYLRGEITIEHAVKLASVATGQYARRQATWFRHQRLGRPECTHTIHAPYPASTQYLETVTLILENFLYTAG